MPALAAGPPPPQVSGREWLVENGVTGEVLLAHHARGRVPIASLTKLMTVLLTLEHAKLTDVVTVSPQAAAIGESSAGLVPGEKLTVRQLLDGALVASANDAADALASYVGHGSETRFVAMMNARARRLGLRSSHYVRPDGLDAAGHVSSARDVTFLARLLMHRPAIRQIVRQRAATLPGGRVLHTWNDLLYSYPGIFGVKTGHTSEAGWNQVAAARRGGVSIYATLIGSPDRSTRNRDLAKLLDWGFAHYTQVRPVVRGRQYAEAKLATADTRSGSSPPARSGSWRASTVRSSGGVIYRDTASLPVSRGQSLGQVRIYQEGRLLGVVPLVAARSVTRPGLAGRAGWYAGRTLHHVLGWF